MMAFWRRKRGKYIDLADYEVEEPEIAEAERAVYVVELGDPDQLRKVKELIEREYVVVFDLTPMMENEFGIKKVASELAEAAKDYGGDAAFIDPGRMIMYVPRGMRIRRQRIRLAAE